MAKVKLKFWFRKLRFNRRRTATSYRSSLSSKAGTVPRHGCGVTLVELEKLDPSCGQGSSSLLLESRQRNPNLLPVRAGLASEAKCSRKTTDWRSSQAVDCGCRPKKSTGSRSMQFCTSGRRSWCKTSSNCAQAPALPAHKMDHAKETRMKTGKEMEVPEQHRKSVHMDRHSSAKLGIINRTVLQQPCKEFSLNSELHKAQSPLDTETGVITSTSCGSRTRLGKQKNIRPNPSGIITNIHEDNSTHENSKSSIMQDVSVSSPFEELIIKDGKTNKAAPESALSAFGENAAVAMMAKCKYKIKPLQCVSTRIENGELDEDRACMSIIKSKSPLYALARYSASAATVSDLHSWERDFPSFTSEDTFFSSFERSRRSFSSTSSSIEFYDRKSQSYSNVTSSDASLSKPKGMSNGDIDVKRCMPDCNSHDGASANVYSNDVSDCGRDAAYSNESILVPCISNRSEHKWLYGIQEDCIDDTDSNRPRSHWISNPDVEYYEDEYARRHERARRKLGRRRHCTNPVLLRRRAQWQAKWKLIQDQVKQSTDDCKNTKYGDGGAANANNYMDFIHQKVQSARRTSRRRALSLDQISAGIMTSTIKSLDDHDNSKSVATSQSARFQSESVAVVKCSSDPLTDFQRSMVDMILDKEICTSQDLEELLHCFLSLNSIEHHDTIITAFTQIWNKIFNDQQNQNINDVGT